VAKKSNQPPKPPRPPSEDKETKQKQVPMEPEAEVVAAENEGEQLAVEALGQPISRPPQSTASPLQLHPDQDAMEQMLRQRINRARTPDQRFWLFVFSEDDGPAAEEYDTLDAMIERIREIDQQASESGRSVAVYPTLAYRMRITKPPYRYLMTPFGHIPMFELPEFDTADGTDAYLGAPPRQMEVPTQSSGERGAYDADATGETDEAEEEEDDAYEDDTYEDDGTLVGPDTLLGEDETPETDED